MYTTRIFTSILSLLLGLTTILGTNIRPVFDAVEADNLQNNRINCIIQDSCGFIWFGSSIGLYRYDGYETILFNTTKDESGTGNIGAVNSILLLPDNDLLLGTRYGLRVYKNDSHSIKRFQSKKCNELNRCSIHAMQKSQNGDVWIGTNKGLYHFKDNLDSIKAIKAGFEAYNTTSFNEIRSLAIDSDGNIWTGTADGLFRYNPRTEEAYRVEITRQETGYPKEDLILSLLVDERNKDILWVGTEKGLYKYNHLTESVEDCLRKENDGNIRNNRIRALGQTDASLFIGTDLGLNAFQRQDKSIQHFFHNILDNSSIPNNNIRSIFRDKDGNIWIGTDEGVCCLENNEQIFNASKIYLNKESFTLSRNTAITKGQNEDLILGSYNGVISVKDNQDLIIKDKIGSEGAGLTHSIVRSLLLDRKGTLWTGTDNGLHFYDSKSGKYVKLDSMPRFAPSIAEDKYGNIWISEDNGLIRVRPEYDAKGNLVSVKDTTITESTGDYFFPKIIRADKKGNLWVSDYSERIHFFSHNDQTLTPARKAETEKEPYQIRTIEPINSDSLLIATNKGVWVYDRKQESYALLDLGTQSNESFYTISITGQGKWWFGMNSGFISYAPLTKRKDFFPYNGTMSIKSASPNASLVDNSDIIYICLNGGYISFDGRSETKPVPSRHMVRITKTMIENESQLTEHERLKLTHDVKSFTVYFSQFNYNNPKAQSYCYKLDGWDDDWTTTADGINYASYSNLPSGRYTFLVRGKAITNEAETIATALPVRILPPWWQSWWAYLIYTFLIGIVTYFVFSTTKTKIKLFKEIERQRIERDKTEELNQSKLRFFTEISHELRTPLTLILGPIDLLYGESDNPNHKNLLLMMKNNAERLLRLTNQLLDLRKLDMHKMKLNPSYGDIVAFVHNVFAFFEEKAQEKGIKYSFETTKESLYTSFDKDKIEKTVYNLISNALKFTDEGGSICVKVSLGKEELGDDVIQIDVADDGPGIIDSEKEAVFDRFFQGEEGISIGGTGLGLAICREYVALHKGRIEEIGKFGEGATFRVCIPVTGNASDEETESAETDSAETNGTGSSKVSEKRDVILVVEDNKEMRDYLNLNLSRDYDVLLAKNGEEAMQIIRKSFPDLIVTDYMMPVMDGKELCRNISKEFDTHIPTIILTAKTEETSMIEGLNAGADDYIFKPFTFNILKIRIDKQLKLQKETWEKHKKLLLSSPKRVLAESEDDKFLVKIMDAIEDHIDESELKVEDICRQLKLPHHQVYRKVKALTGQTLSEFIRSVRLKRAAQLLKDSDYTVSEIMYRCGFTGSSYFSKCFVEEFSMTPSEYIRKYRTNNHPKDDETDEQYGN